MTTLQAIGGTLAGGTVVLSACITAFGFAVRHQSPYIAPRATARPPSVIYNPHAPKGHVQYHFGSPWFGWLWKNNWSYETLLKGVPGTGTRKGGLEGTLLHVTLDGIVVLRFHVLSRKLALVATLLCCFLLLPLYLSAPCISVSSSSSNNNNESNKELLLYECNATLLNVQTNNFRHTTLSHVPDVMPETLIHATAIYMRLYTVVAVLWVITLYAFVLLKQEWADLLALRRIYFLERRPYSTEWRQRLLKQASSINISSSLSLNGNSSHHSTTTMIEDDDDELQQQQQQHVSPRRPPWIPHPEQPDTVPNVEPYSILIGHIPRTTNNDETTTSLQQLLVSLTKLWERSLPTEPGYSSPLVAITLLPPANAVGRVWRHWYTTASLLRKLQFIQQHIQPLQQQQQQHSSQGGPHPHHHRRRRRRDMYLSEILGTRCEGDDDMRSQAWALGPEQTAVYSRELAQAASPCAPYGWCVEGRVRRASLAELLDLEEDVMLHLHNANQELEHARQQVLTAYYETVMNDNDDSLAAAPTDIELTAFNNHHPTLVGDDSEHGSSKLRDLRDRHWWSRIATIPWNNDYYKWHQWRSWTRAVTREHTYAVITFTSRQAAAAARQCLIADSNHNEVSHLTLHDIPIPPLADAAPCVLLPCRFFCRPVTVAMNDVQKNARFYLVLGWLGLLYIFYTIPLTFAASQVDPETIAYLFPDHTVLSDRIGVNLPELLSGLASSIVWSFFFMMCPQVFKMIAYFGSSATSLAQAERRALQYFWWFMVITAFTGPMLAYWVLAAVNKSQRLDEGLRELLIRIAGATPTLIAANWLNWIIYRFTIILPINFLLQFNTFMFSFLGMKCCSRMTIGGGPGGPIPYRILVDSGVVLMCVFALAPASPLVAPAALAYFSFCEPLLRRNLIFVYRPRYDDGGLRWIFVFDMIISALVMGQLLLSLQMGLKNALGPGLACLMAIPATIAFQWYCKRKYDPAFENTALLRTNLLDGWETLDEMSMEHREEHRRFLVDAHKAAYVPACLAGTETAASITTEPAVVVPHSIDSDSERSTSARDGPKPRRATWSEPMNRSTPDVVLGVAPPVVVESPPPSSGLAWLESAIDQDDVMTALELGRLSLFRGTAQKSE